MAQTTVVQIGYVRDHRTGNFIASLVNPTIKSNLRRQEIVVLLMAHSSAFYPK